METEEPTKQQKLQQAKWEFIEAAKFVTFIILAEVFL